MPEREYLVVVASRDRRRVGTFPVVALSVSMAATLMSERILDGELGAGAAWDVVAAVELGELVPVVQALAVELDDPLEMDGLRVIE